MKKIGNYINKFIRFFKRYIKKIMKVKGWTKAVLITGIVLIILMFINKDIIYKEGFTQKDKFVLKKGTDIYDELMLYVQDYGRTCEYCQQPWTYVRRLGTRGEGQKSRKSGIETNFSIDRLDTTKTYSRDNIIFCCVGCNNRKNQVRLSDLINILRVWKNKKI